MAKFSIEGKGDKKELVIRLPMQDGVKSSSGKSYVVATTNGNADSGLTIDGKQVKVGVNAYYSAKE